MGVESGREWDIPYCVSYAVGVGDGGKQPVQLSAVQKGLQWILGEKFVIIKKAFCRGDSRE